MPALFKTARKWLLLLLILLGAAVAWLFWNRPQKVDMAAYVPAESLAFIQTDDLSRLAQGISHTEAWRKLAAPLGAPEELVPQSWFVPFSRWTGIGSAESVLLARSQFALCFTQAQATESGSTLTIKPLAALVIETHTSQRRMQPIVENYVEQFAQRAYGTDVKVTRKEINGVEFRQWSNTDNTRRLVLATSGTVAIVGNDESAVMTCVEVRLGHHRSLAEDAQLQAMRPVVENGNANISAFVPKAGVKVLIQAWALSRARNSAEASSIAPLISNTFGNVIDSFAWTLRFDEAGAEDRCHVALASVSQQLTSIRAGQPFGTLNFPFAPANASSITEYHLNNPQTFWRELNALLSSRSDVLGAMATRPLLHGLLEPYGVTDADAFFAAIGPRLQILRENTSAPAVLIAEAMDKQALRTLAMQRVGSNSKLEQLDQGELFLSTKDDWAIAFVNNYFLSGPGDAVRRCLDVKARGELLSEVAAFRRSQSMVDLSLPFFSITFADDKTSAIAFVESFSKQERSAFSTNATAIQQAAASLEFSTSVTTLKDGSFEWTSRSSFGVLGSLLTTLAPENLH